MLEDTPDTGLPQQRSTVVYDLPLDGSRPALPTLTATEIDRWAQSTVPTDLTAVFGPDTVPTGSPVTVGTVTDSQWRGAQLSALDVNGRQVNTASFGGTASQDSGADQAPGWRIGTTEYDTAGRGNTVRTLTAGNRERALAGSPTGDVAVQKAQAIRLDVRNVYSPDGKDLLRSYGPARQPRSSVGPAPSR